MYKPLSIKKEGLESYLNRTTDKHNGFGYLEFIKLMKAKVPVTKLAKAFQVNRVTIKKWQNIHLDSSSDNL